MVIIEKRSCFSLEENFYVCNIGDAIYASGRYTGVNTAMQRQTAVTAHLKSKQLLLFVFPRPNVTTGV